MVTQEELTATLEHIVPVSENRVQLQTFKRSFEQICQGEDPWLPLGNFMHQSFGYYKHLRPELVSEPLEVPEHPSPDQVRWAAFCAASVEYLCEHYAIPCPAWALHSRYTLEQPWYYDLNADLPEVQEELRQTTPAAFTRRAIFCGDRVYRNKYEHKGRLAAARH